MLNLYIDGMDNTGKSTLARFISEDLKIQIIHFPPPPEGKSEAFVFYQDKLNEAIAVNPKGIILDRFVWSNRVYNGIYGGGVVNDTCMDSLENKLIKHGFISILTISDPAKIKDRITKELNAWEMDTDRLNKPEPEPLGGDLTEFAIQDMQKNFFSLQQRSELCKVLLDTSLIINYHATGEPTRGEHYFMFLKGLL